MTLMDGLMIVLLLFLVGLLFGRREYIPVQHRHHSEVH